MFPFSLVGVERIESRVVLNQSADLVLCEFEDIQDLLFGIRLAHEGCLHWPMTAERRESVVRVGAFCEGQFKRAVLPDGGRRRF